MHDGHRNKILNHKLNKFFIPTCIKIKENLSEKKAFKLETELIKLIGRIDLKTGPLCNFTNGGEGTSGVIVSEETRKKRSEVRIGKKRPPRSKKWGMNISKGKKGKPVHTSESKAQISKSLMGIKRAPRTKEHTQRIIESKKRNGYVVSEETRKKLSEGHKKAHKRRKALGIPNPSTRPEVRAKISQTLRKKNAKIREFLKKMNFGKD
jgi:hypothetical protein